MDEEIKQRINGYLDAVESAANDAGGFVMDQAPLVAQEYVSWMFWSGMLLFLTCLFAILVLVFVPIWKWKAIKENQMEPIIIAPLMVAVMLVTPAMIGGSQALKASVAPRVILLEKAADMVKRL
ncbi:MAG: hypothetical protein CMK32_10165 [Porticoccaceae bacterium]|nr:hypothetical protein [Porticoccaceae bacterium]